MVLLLCFHRDGGCSITRFGALDIQFLEDQDVADLNVIMCNGRIPYSIQCGASDV